MLYLPSKKLKKLILIIKWKRYRYDTLMVQSQFTRYPYVSTDYTKKCISNNSDFKRPLIMMVLYGCFYTNRITNY